MSSIPGEYPPPPPRVCFGRNELIKKIIDLSENLTPIALIGVGGIGKTSIALTVLHHDHIKKQFGDNRRFIRCDQFPAALPHFLRRLSKAVGAGVGNPEDLTPLRPFLSSMQMIICLDNAESILDPQGANAEDIYDVVEELSRFSNICLCITSRISTIPTACKILNVPTLSIEAAHNTFYSIYENGDRESSQISSILEQLDFHPLSVTLLATVAHHSKWSTNRLASEWERQRTDMLHTRHNKSLAATIELSLSSPMFCELGTDARELLGVIAFFPQGVNEDNLDWLFPTLSNKLHIFDTFCILSLTSPSDGYITMLAPLREYLCPKDPTSSLLLLATKDHYFSRLEVELHPDEPGFAKAQWIRLEDVNVEHLLNVFTSVDPDSNDVWIACARFLEHLYWYKQRLVVLGPKIQGLPDEHPCKPQCLSDLALLFETVGNYVECRELLVETTMLWVAHGDALMVAHSLRFLSKTNGYLKLYKEGIEQAAEALNIYKELDNAYGQGVCLGQLAQLYHNDDQLDSAEEAATQAIDLLSDVDNQSDICNCYRLLGKISNSKGETDKALGYFKKALEIATASKWHDTLYWVHCNMADLFFVRNEFEDAHTHIEQAKSYAINDLHRLGRATENQALYWYKESKYEEARSEALCAANVYEKIGATKDVEECHAMLQDIEEALSKPGGSH